MFGEGFVDEAAVGGDVQQGNVAVVIEELRILAGMGKDEVLDDKFDIDHAAARVFDVAVNRRMGWGTFFFAHFDDFACQGGLVAFGGEDFGADAVEGRLNIRRATNKTGAGKGLVFPRPGVFALVFFKGGDAVRKETGVAVGAQAQVYLEERAGCRARLQPAGHALCQLGIDAWGVLVRVVVEEHQVQV